MAERFRIVRDRVQFQLRLTPRGGRDAIEGWAESDDGRSYLRARVRVAPEDGKANAALIALLSKELDVAKSALTLVSGETSRLKTIAATGDTTRLAARLQNFGEG
ncbi:MAG TPA: DUF167 family protein [Rhizomicrobium sp.]|jgi:uncharacterized protein YggU (UPF0235/DUF167 family)|nr:DUF167 family protein [Rhizomicrobium sp.]